MTDRPWTWREFHAAMKATGWQRIPGDPAGCRSYQHRSGYCYTATDVVMRDGRQVENWEIWAEVRETPPPF